MRAIVVANAGIAVLTSTLKSENCAEIRLANSQCMCTILFDGFSNHHWGAFVNSAFFTVF